MAIADVFNFRGDWVKIHVDLMAEGDRLFYSITAKDEHDCPFTGFEYRVDAFGDGDPQFVISSPQISRLVKLAREDVEQDRWDEHLQSIDGRDNVAILESPYERGRKAYKCKCNDHTNPFDEDTAEADEWLRGWADEYEANPHEFNTSTGEFNSGEKCRLVPSYADQLPPNIN